MGTSADGRAATTQASWRTRARAARRLPGWLAVFAAGTALTLAASGPPMSASSGSTSSGSASAVSAPAEASEAPAGPPPSRTLTWTRRDLGTLPGTDSYPIAVSGHYIVGAATLRNSGDTHAFVCDLDAAAPTLRDLGTLGGTSSTADAVDGSIAIGSADTASATHAFAYDLGAATPHMRDLGTLGGRDSTAYAIDGSLVVGEAAVRGGASHAFVYDLSAATPKMRDLGTLGGRLSIADAISDDIVVGIATTREAVHAFVYDLGATTPTMRDLGALGGITSSAYDVDGSLVVGLVSPRGGGWHAFVYDLSAAVPTMRDLGSIGGAFTSAGAVSGSLVVGNASIDRSTTRAFVYDLAAAAPRMKRIGLGGNDSAATGLDGKVVVGRAARAGDHRNRFFAYDLSGAEPEIADLGANPLESGLAVGGNIVVGEILAAGGSGHVGEWTLARTTKPALRFDRVNTTVPENVGRATVTVTRAGDPGPAVTVPYTTKAISDAVPGKDFTATAGILTFGAGQTRGSFTVPIRNDAAAERDEALMVTLGRPTGGAIRGTPKVAALTIEASDQRPDALISTRPGSRYIGNNIYNTTGAKQTRTSSAHRARTHTFYVRVYNDGTITNTLTLHGSPPRAGVEVRYYRGSSDVTTAMRSTAGLKLRIDAQAHRQLTMRIKVAASAPIGSRLPGRVTATWTGDGTRTDLVRGVVKVVR